MVEELLERELFFYKLFVVISLVNQGRITIHVTLYKSGYVNNYHYIKKGVCSAKISLGSYSFFQLQLPVNGPDVYRA